jgi:tetratricopeptide (TPR) repeat protein
MPATVNGIGTTYYGKKNLETRADFCEHCHRQVNLRSYDTRLWFVVVFIPIIPLGRKRVIDYCPACTKHRVTELVQWEQAKRTSLTAATEKFKTQPTPEAAVELHALLMGFNQSAQAAEFRRFLREKFADNAKVQAYLGQVWQELGQFDEARPCFEQALRIEPDLPAAKAGVGQALIREGKLDEAREVLAYLEAPDAVKQYPLVPLNDLALAYQKAGRHKEALDLFRKLMAGVPELAQDKAYRKVVRASETVLGAGPSALPPRIVPWRRIIGWSAAGVPALVAAIGSNLYTAGHRTVYLVNGFDQAVTVAVAQRGSTAVRPGTFTTVPLPEGPHQVVFDGPVNQTNTVTITGSFFERWFGDTVFVINPGGAALLLWEEATYGRNSNPADPQSFRIYFGDAFHVFPNIDYPFQPFPQSIRTKASSDTKTRVDLLRADHVSAFVALLSRQDYSEALRLAEWSLRLRPATNVLLSAYVNMARSQKRGAQAAALLRSGLGRRPVDIAWHRAYQELLADDKDSDRLLSDYDGFLKAEPGDSALLYLRGRLSTNQAEADTYFQRALAANPTNAYAHNAVGFRRASLGDWPGARREIGRAHELMPLERGFAVGLLEARMAVGELAALQQELQAHLLQNLLDQSACLELCDVFAAEGKTNEARRLVGDYERLATARFKQEAGETIRTARRHLLYSIGDFAGLEQAVTRDTTLDGRWSLYHALIESGRVAEAVKVFPLNDPKVTEPWHFLTTSIAWQAAGNAPQAALWRARAIELFAAGRREWRPVGDVLRSTNPIAVDELMDLPIPPKTKAILLVALAQRFPAQAPEYLAKVRLLNVERSFPYHLLTRLSLSSAVSPVIF